MINFSLGDSNSILVHVSEDMEISLEDEERTLTIFEDLCSEDVAGNANSRSPASLAGERNAAAAGAAAEKPLVKLKKIAKKKS